SLPSVRGSPLRKCGSRSVARVIRPGHPAKRDKEVSDTNRSRYARCPGLMTRATRGSSCTYFHRRHEDTRKGRESCQACPGEAASCTSYVIMCGREGCMDAS